MSVCASVSSVASVQPSQTSAQPSSRTRCRLLGAVGGTMSLLGSLVASTVLLVATLPPDQSHTLMLNEYLVAGVRWRMTTVRFSGGPATQLICSVTRLPFMLMPYEQQWLATLSMDFVQLSCTCEGPRTVASRTGA